MSIEEKGMAVRIVEFTPSAKDLLGVTGQVTAHGTITAAVNNVVTAESRGFVTAQVTAGWPIGVTGQVTAHGTVTAEVKGTLTAAINNVVTAESRGQITAVGTVTAEVKGTLTAAVSNVVTAESRGFVTAQVSGGWPIGITGGPIGVTGEVTARGEITAHGTVTAAINNIVTAESRGQVTAVGTVTAEVKGTLTAQVSGGPVGVTGGPLYSQFGSAWLISGQSATGTAQGFDSRPYSVGLVYCNFSGNSASATLLASHDSATWMAITSYYSGQLTANSQFTAQLNAYYPYLAGRVDFVSASGGVTAGCWMHVSRL